MILTNHAYNALNKISSAIKADWFYLTVDRDGQDVVLDLERYGGTECFMDIPTAVSQLLDGMVDPIESGFYKLSKDETQAFNDLLVELGLVYI